MKYLIILTTLFISISAQAIKPVDGFYWDPTSSGRGLTIEVQKNTLVVAFYAYDDSNIGRWYLGSGPYDSNASVFNGHWDAYDGGQCAGCAYTSPTINTGESKGAFTINFLSWQKARMTWAGGTTNLERFNFSYPSPNSYIQGTWVTTEFIDTLAIGEKTIFMGETFINDGTEFVQGSLFGSLSRPAVGSLIEVDPADGENIYGILLDSSSSFYRYYVYKANKNKFAGLSYLYLKTEQPGSGLPVIGSKIGEYQPTTKNSKSVPENERPLQDEIDAHEYALQKEHSTSKGGVEITQIQLDTLMKLQNQIETQK
jgi:hypothetical protein